MRGIICKTFPHGAGFFFVRGEDGKEYYANRRMVLTTDYVSKSMIRKHLEKLAVVGKTVSFIPAGPEKDGRGTATNIIFEVEKRED
ncbi:MAG: hypothetical protein MR671_04810 [Clostridiales bacterium]|nr:hypothetical protein [Clostridiales bacterium]